MNTPTRCLLLPFSVLTIVLFACGDDEDPTQPVLVKPPAVSLIGSYELLDFREWGYVIANEFMPEPWGPMGTRTDYSYTPASYETYSGHMAVTDTMLHQLFVQDGDSVRMLVDIRDLTYTHETDQGLMETQYGFSIRSLTFDCTGMELRFDYETITAAGPFSGENTRWEIWRKISDAADPPS